jgi:hypothetical protein
MSARRQRFAHCAESQKPQTQKRTIFLSHASLPRNFLREFRRKISTKDPRKARPSLQGATPIETSPLALAARHRRNDLYFSHLER